MNLTIWSEIELAYRFLQGRLIGINRFEWEDHDHFARRTHLRQAGFSTSRRNIGTPLIASVEATRDDTITVAELSSFQLELRRPVSVLTSVFS